MLGLGTRWRDCARRLADGLNWTRGATLLLALAMAAGVGCASDKQIRLHASEANELVLQQADGEFGARMRSSEVNAYIADMAGQVLEAARALRPVIEVDKEGNPLAPELRAENDWIYDELTAVVLIDKVSNAFVVGDNSVYIHSGLIVDVECAEQLLACLCHEMGHIVLRHSKNDIESKQRRVALIAAAVALSFVDSNAAAALGAGAGLNDIMAFCNNKQEEHDADDYATALFVSMGYDPSHFARFFDVLREKLGDGGAMSSHPQNSTRAARVREIAATIPHGEPYKSMDRVQFERIRGIVLREQEFFEGETVLSNPEVRVRAFSCFDYCQH